MQAETETAVPAPATVCTSTPAPALSQVCAPASVPAPVPVPAPAVAPVTIVPSQNVIFEGDPVILAVEEGTDNKYICTKATNSAYIKVVHASLNSISSAKIKKRQYSLKPLLGLQYGSTFLADISGVLIPRLGAPPMAVVPDTLEDEVQGSSTTASGLDNRNLVDDNTAQTLTAQQIHEMKQKGASGRQIIDVLVDYRGCSHIAGFNRKQQNVPRKNCFLTTKVYKEEANQVCHSYSQFFYEITRYMPVVKVLKPTANLIATAYYTKTPQKIWYE